MCKLGFIGDYYRLGMDEMITNDRIIIIIPIVKGIVEYSYSSWIIRLMRNYSAQSFIRFINHGTITFTGNHQMAIQQIQIRMHIHIHWEALHCHVKHPLINIPDVIPTHNYYYFNWINIWTVYHLNYLFNSL